MKHEKIVTALAAVVLGCLNAGASKAAAIDALLSEAKMNFGQESSRLPEATVVVYSENTQVQKFVSIDSSLRETELELIEINKGLSRLSELADSGNLSAARDIQLQVIVSKLQYSNKYAQTLHAESADGAFWAHGAENSECVEAAAKVEATSKRILILIESHTLPMATRIHSMLGRETLRFGTNEALLQVADIQRFAHDLEYHIKGVSRSAEAVLAASATVGRPGFPIPFPIPFPPPHPPVNPPHPSDPDDSAIQQCKEDCNFQYDADCEACGILTDPRAKELCYSSAADRQGTCIRNCYRE